MPFFFFYVSFIQLTDEYSQLSSSEQDRFSKEIIEGLFLMESLFFDRKDNLI